jgi:hypothetical protein
MRGNCTKFAGDARCIRVSVAATSNMGSGSRIRYIGQTKQKSKVSMSDVSVIMTQNVRLAWVKIQQTI